MGRLLCIALATGLIACGGKTSATADASTFDDASTSDAGVEDAVTQDADAAPSCGDHTDHASDAGQLPATCFFADPEAITALWGSASTDVWAVGTGGKMFHFDGSAWSKVASGVPTALCSLSGTSAKDVWTTGTNGLALHWDGAAWSCVDTHSRATLVVTASSPTDTWAYDRYGDYTLRWDGGDWTSVASPKLYTAWSAGPGDVWALTSDAYVHWNGSSWSNVAAQPGASFLAGRADDAQWAAPFSTYHTWSSMHRWDGTSFQTDTSWPSSWDTISAVWAAPKQDVWVTITMVDTPIGAGPHTHAHRWDGTQWNGVSTQTDVRLLAVWGAADDDVWLAGTRDQSLGAAPAPVMLHWDGSTATEVALP